VSPPIAVGIDIGGTHLRAGIVGPDGLVGPALRRRSAVDDPAPLVASVMDVLDELGAGRGTDVPIGIGVAGLVDREGRLRYGPNVRVREVPLADLLRTELGGGRTVRVVNDASAAVVAEHRLGAGRGHHDVVLFTLGTGVGGGVIVADHLLEGAHGFAGELGHLIIVEDGRDAPSGVRGTVEAYASGSAIAREAGEAVMAGLAGARASDTAGVVSAAGVGEGWAIAVLERVGVRLGIAIASVVAVLDPSVVVVGGGAGGAAAPFLLPAARGAFATHLMGASHRPVAAVVAAVLGDDAGVIGAGLLATDAAVDAAGRGRS